VTTLSHATAVTRLLSCGLAGGAAGALQVTRHCRVVERGWVAEQAGTGQLLV
jgi:hypothetical protein